MSMALGMSELRNDDLACAVFSYAAEAGEKKDE